MIERDILKECASIADRYPCIRKLLDSYIILSESPYVDSYMVVYDLISSWQSELKANGSKVQLLRAEDKAFDRAFKLSTSMPDLISGLDNIRAKMTPEQKEDSEKKRRAKKSEGKIIL